MTSKKYIIQPLSIPPPAKHRQNGSRTISLLAKNSKSLHALGPSDIKKREKEPAPSVVLSPFAPYDQHKDFDYKRSPEKTSEHDTKDQPPPDLETDLKRYHAYIQNEARIASSSSSPHGCVHPFQYIGTKEDDTEEKQSQTKPEADFSQWIKEMNTKLITSKRQIRHEKKRAEREKQDVSHNSSSSSSLPSLPKKQKSTLFQLRKKKTKKDDEYDTLGNMAPRRSQTEQNLTKRPPPEDPRLNRAYSHQLTPIPKHSSGYTKSSSTPSQSSSTASSTSSPNDLRLFQIVRIRTPSVSEDEPPLTSRTSPRNGTSSSSNSPRGNNNTSSTNNGGSTSRTSPRNGTSTSASSSTSSIPSNSPRDKTSSAGNSPRTPTSTSAVTPFCPPPSPTSSTTSAYIPSFATPSTSSSSNKSQMGKSQSFSFRRRQCVPSTPLSSSHHSEHDMRTKRIPRNVVSVSIST